MASNGLPADGTYFVGARTFMSKDKTRELAQIDLVEVGGRDGPQCVTLWTEPAVAKAAARDMGFMEPCVLETETRLRFGQMRAELVAVSPAA